MTYHKRTLIEIEALAKSTELSMVGNAERWKKFLQSTAFLYRYSFPDQILIYAQKTNATACADYETWNEKVYCYIKRGEQGIALIDKTKRSGLRYVFDVTSVEPYKDKGKLPNIWQMKEEYRDTIYQSLKDSYGSVVKTASLEENLLQIVHLLVRDTASKSDQPSIELLEASVAYRIFSRCGFNTSQWENRLNFTGFQSLQTQEEMVTLGKAVCELSRPVLMEIRRSISKYEKWKAVDTTIEKEGKEKIDGDYLQTGRGLFDTESGEKEATGRTANHVRADVRALFRGVRRGTVRHLPPRWDAEAEVSGQAGGSTQDGRDAHGSDGEGRRGDVAIETRRPVRLGTEDVQHPESGTGDREGRGDLQEITGRLSEDRSGEARELLQASIPGEIEQRSNLAEKAEDERASAFSIWHEKNRTEEEKNAISAPYRNFRITEDLPAESSPKERCRKNILAIQTLKDIESDHRMATVSEQKILAQYTGWGGLSEAFDLHKKEWHTEFSALKKELTEKEYEAARSSALSAFFTPPEVINEMYGTLQALGVAPRSILEPSMGSGRFFGLLPDSFLESKLYGVELDELTGRMAKKLYPDADIQIKGYEKASFRDDAFDLAIGNIPFGEYKVYDEQFHRQGQDFLIHDYFFAKSLAKVRPGGILAFVTSKGTLDKKSEEARRYLAERANLIGAVRLPNTAFQKAAGTKVSTDILFLQKKDRPTTAELIPEEDWISLERNPDGILMNRYFVNHPEMIVGKMEMITGRFGQESACLPDLGNPFSEQLHQAMRNICKPMEREEIDAEEISNKTREIVVDQEVRPFSYAMIGGEVYFKEADSLHPVAVSSDQINRLRGLVEIRDLARELIDVELHSVSDQIVEEAQLKLNQAYDRFQEKYGNLSSAANRRVFEDDSSYVLLTSIEDTDADGKVIGKGRFFSERTIRRAIPVDHVETASEALIVSLNTSAKVNLPYMAQLCGKTEEEVVSALRGEIYKDPISEKWQTTDEYLSGNVRKKLKAAEIKAKEDSAYVCNVSALKQIIPEDLAASEIEARLGAPWIEPKYITQFMVEVFNTPPFMIDAKRISVEYSPISGEWNISGKTTNPYNPLTTKTYGTEKINAYQILEKTLNSGTVQIYDQDPLDRKKRVKNKKETLLAMEKQDAIKAAFQDWVFKEPERREDLCRKYNDLYNATKPREYNGEHLDFPGMDPAIRLKKHQLNAVAHTLYGKNTLLAHCVGSGKTFEMAASAMQCKRLGLCHKPLFVVPNHLTEQWAHEFLRLYPGANILAATKKDFQPTNRKRFCARIATGNWDAVIIGHSQFEKIPLSQKRQNETIQKQLSELDAFLRDVRSSRGSRFTVRAAEAAKKKLEYRLSKLNENSKKDHVIDFEELGVDRLFVDESHHYKNLYFATKMSNVSGLSPTGSQKASDMLAKCEYINEINGGSGVVFASGTPISNSMTELYTNMRYIQSETLKEKGLSFFDAWAASFGETETAVELAPEGTGYRTKTRFSHFFNLPELIGMFKECADIQTADMLALPVPEVSYHTEVLQPSEIQKELVSKLSERADVVRQGAVDAQKDNMLNITNDGRKLALDQRLLNEMYPESDQSKTSVCADRAVDLYKKYDQYQAAQLIFCDISTPKADGSFNVYDDLREKLIERGIPEKEIAYIHNAKTELQKEELFTKVKAGKVRFLLGSTAKMGAGTNVQNHLIALHHLDCPWRPSDIEQREGRIIRQGNQFRELGIPVQIYRYVTEGTFDAYSWQVVENKQKFISQIMTSKSAVRSCNDVDGTALTYAEVKALAAGNPLIKEKMQLDVDVSRLKLAKASHQSNIYRLQDAVRKEYPRKIAGLESRIQALVKDLETAKRHPKEKPESFEMSIGKTRYTGRKSADAALLKAVRDLGYHAEQNMAIGEYRGFVVSGKCSFQVLDPKDQYRVSLQGATKHTISISSTKEASNILRLDNLIEEEKLKEQIESSEMALKVSKAELASSLVEMGKPFVKEAELTEKMKRLDEVNALLNMDEKDTSAAFLEDNQLERQGGSKKDAKGQEEDLGIAITVQGKPGEWIVCEKMDMDATTYLLLRSKQFGTDAMNLIADSAGNYVMDCEQDRFSNGLRENIRQIQRMRNLQLMVQGRNMSDIGQNPLLNAEVDEEGSYDFIDGVPNNGYGEKNKKEYEKVLQRGDSSFRPSLIHKIKAYEKKLGEADQCSTERNADRDH